MRANLESLVTDRAQHGSVEARRPVEITHRDGDVVDHERYIIAAGCESGLNIGSVIPAQAGIHIPEMEICGTMGPRFRGDDTLLCRRTAYAGAPERTSL